MYWKKFLNNVKLIHKKKENSKGEKIMLAKVYETTGRVTHTPGCCTNRIKVNI